MRLLQRALLAAVIACSCSSRALAAGVVHPDAESVRPLPVGAAVPNPRLHTLDGEPADLRTALRGSGALLVFYRGGW